MASSCDGTPDECERVTSVRTPKCSQEASDSLGGCSEHQQTVHPSARMTVNNSSQSPQGECRRPHLCEGRLHSHADGLLTVVEVAEPTNELCLVQNVGSNLQERQRGCRAHEKCTQSTVTQVKGMLAVLTRSLASIRRIRYASVNIWMTSSAVGRVGRRPRQPSESPWKRDDTQTDEHKRAYVV